MGLFAGIKNSTDNGFIDLTIQGIDGEINVYRDEFGVPTIIADTINDLVFGQGFEFARDRSFQLEFYRSLINGELAALFGPDLVETDQVVRSVGLKAAAELMYEKLNTFELGIIESYVKGINTYYETHRHNKPLEAELLGFELQPWEVTDTIAIGSIVAFTFAFGGLSNEIQRLKIIDKLGMDNFLELYPVDYAPADSYYRNNTDIYYPNMDENENQLSLSSIQGADFISALEPIFGSVHSELIKGHMSNNWVVSGNKTESGNPIIANDPHTSLGAQGIWHRVNLMSTDGEIKLQGFNFPGTPLLAFGHNKHLAWGVTSGIMDSVDLFYINQNDTHYLFNGTEWREFELIKSVIEVSGGTDIDFEYKLTNMGPVVDTELGQFVMAWTLNQNYQRDNPIRSLIGINLATSIVDIHEYLEYMLTGFNWVFADMSGDIGYQNSGLIPNRGEGYGLIPQNGSAANTFWKGLIPYKDQLSVQNPESGYFATANERVDDRENFYISEVYATRHRDDRIEQVLENGTDFDLEIGTDKLTHEDMKQLQLDVKTLVAEDLLDPVLDDLVQYKPEANSLTAEIITLLETWDQKLDYNSVEALVFTTYRLFLPEMIFRDELGDLRDSYSGLRVLTDWYRQGNETSWFDDITTSELNETSTDMAILTLEHTVDYLSDRFGTDLSNWKWGDKHRVILPHTFSGITDIMDIGNVGAGGSSLTVNAISGPSWNEGDIDYTSSYGPYFRAVYSVEPTWNNIEVSVSSGASGNPLSPHYDDAYEEWINFDYHKWQSSLDYVYANYQHKTTLRSDN